MANHANESSEIYKFSHLLVKKYSAICDGYLCVEYTTLIRDGSISQMDPDVLLVTALRLTYSSLLCRSTACNE
jgi:hypothetical protein